MYNRAVHTCYNISRLVQHDVSTIQPVTTTQSFSESVQRRRTAQHCDQDTGRTYHCGVVKMSLDEEEKPVESQCLLKSICKTGTNWVLRENQEGKKYYRIYMLFIIQGQVFWKVIGAKQGVKVDPGFNFSCTCISAFNALIFFLNLTSGSKSNLTVKKYDQQTSQKSYWSIFFHWLSETK